MHWQFFIAALACLCFGACAQLGRITGMEGKKKNPGKKPPGVMDPYRAAGGRVSGDGGGASSAGMASAAVGSSGGITADADIQWAPENPNVPIPGEELWKAPESKTWHVSFREASRLSRQSGKPMLVWFTDSAHSPLCKRLSSELFSKSGFEGWAETNLVRLRVDTQVPPRERNEDIGVRKAKYVAKLKRRFNVHGHPTVVMVSPRGEVIQSYRGYQKGNADYYWGRIRQAVVISERDYGKWREKLEKRGYRMWQSRDGRKTLAKLYRFRPGKVTLIDPDGRRATTSFKKLCDADQAWIMLQKKKYDARRRGRH